MFYLGLLGAPSLRNFGALTVYASMQRPLRIALPGEDWVERDMAVVPPFQPHRIETDDQMIGAIMIEPESIDAAYLPAGLRPSRRRIDDALLERIRAASAYLQRIGPNGSVDGLDGDQLFWGEGLARRRLAPPPGGHDRRAHRQ